MVPHSDGVNERAALRKEYLEALKQKFEARNLKELAECLHKPVTFLYNFARPNRAVSVATRAFFIRVAPELDISLLTPPKVTNAISLQSAISEINLKMFTHWRGDKAGNVREDVTELFRQLGEGDVYVLFTSDSHVFEFDEFGGPEWDELIRAVERGAVFIYLFPQLEGAYSRQWKIHHPERQINLTADLERLRSKAGISEDLFNRPGACTAFFHIVGAFPQP